MRKVLVSLLVLAVVAGVAFAAGPKTKKIILSNAYYTAPY